MRSAWLLSPSRLCGTAINDGTSCQPVCLTRQCLSSLYVERIAQCDDILLAHTNSIFRQTVQTYSGLAGPHGDNILAVSYTSLHSLFNLISKELCLNSCVSSAVHGADLLMRRGPIQTLATYFIRTMTLKNILLWDESAWSTRIFRSAVCNTVPSDPDGQMDSLHSTLV